MEQNNQSVETLDPQEENLYTQPQVEDINDDGLEEDFTPEDLSEELGKLKQQVFNQTKRAEKAEKGLKDLQSKSKPASSSSEATLSTKDIITLAKAGIEDDAIDDVLEYASWKKISVSEALKSPVVQATITHKKEVKTTAEATNTSNARRGGAKISDEALIANASKGIMPESEADMIRLYEAQMRK